jgi:hypothetical protein
VVSPYARRAYVSHGEKSFLSLVRYAFERLGVPLPAGRIQSAGTMADCFTTERGPEPVLTLPQRPCSSGR